MSSKLTVLPAATTPLDGTETYYLVQGGVSKRVVGNNLGRVRLTANRIYYIRTGGADSSSHTGLTNTDGDAFKTLLYATYTTMQQIDGNGFNVTYQFADGTYTTPDFLYWEGVGINAIFIKGNSATPSNCVINTTGAASPCFNFTQNGIPVQMTIDGFKFISDVSALVFGVFAATFAIVQNVEFGSCGDFYIYLPTPCFVQLDGTNTISGGANSAFATESAGANFYHNAGSTLTFTADVAYSGSFALSTIVSSQQYNGTINLNAHTITGVRYVVNKNALIDTNGGGANFLPGNAPGTSASGGTYT